MALIGISHVLTWFGFLLFIGNLVFGILTLSRKNISNKFKKILGISLIIFSVMCLLIFLIGFDMLIT